MVHIHIIHSMNIQGHTVLVGGVGAGSMVPTAINVRYKSYINSFSYIITSFIIQCNVVTKIMEILIQLKMW